MKTDYENSSLYCLGEMYVSMGELLMNPETTIRELAEAGSEYGVHLQFAIVPAPEQQSEDAT